MFSAAGWQLMRTGSVRTTETTFFLWRRQSSRVTALTAASSSDPHVRFTSSSSVFNSNNRHIKYFDNKHHPSSISRRRVEHLPHLGSLKRRNKRQISGFFENACCYFIPLAASPDDNQQPEVKGRTH